MPSVWAWPLWSLSPRALAYVLTVDGGALAALVLSVGARGFGSGRELFVFGLLTACGLVCVEVMRRIGESAGVAQDLMGVWTLPIAVLLPAPYALVAAIPGRWRAQRPAAPSPLYRRIFTAAAIGLGHLAANQFFHAYGSADPLHDWGRRAPLLLATAAAACLLGAAANSVLVALAVRLSSPARWRDLLPDRDTLQLIVVEVSAGLVVTALVADSPALVLAVLAPTIMLQRSLLHAQLRAAARTDPKTGLLNAASWQVEAERALTRTVRQGGALSTLMIDLDRFKAINDTYGHLVGDQVLIAVAGTLGTELRDIDLIGRFGGDEFVVALAADEHQAHTTAERLRRRIAECPHDADGLAVGVTVSIGTATIHPRRGDDLTELLAAADAALYTAKMAGRDRTVAR